MRQLLPNTRAQQVPIKIVGSSTFGRYPFISRSRTINMFISDRALVNYAGFAAISILAQMGEGRGLFLSRGGDFAIAVIGSTVYKILSSLAPVFVGNIETQNGEVRIDENLSQQICIVDGQSAWIYNYRTNDFVKQTLSFAGETIFPAFVAYHDTFFLIAPNPVSENAKNWYVFEFATDTTITINTQLQIETKPDNARAVIPIPGHSNNVLVCGERVSEIWTQVGGAQNYQKVQSFNIDYGLVSIDTVASSDNVIAGLFHNQNSSPFIMIVSGTSTKRVSTDGIDFMLSRLSRPDKSTAIFYEQDGHVFYQLTFYDAADNYTLIYDLNDDAIYDVQDNNFNYHPARQIIRFNNKTYFVSLNDATLYQISSDFISYKYTTDPNDLGETIPRIRVVPPFRLPTSDRFRMKRFTFWLEQGVTAAFIINPDTGTYCDGLFITEDGLNYLVSESGDNFIHEEGSCYDINTRPAVDLSLSTNGNQTFGTRVRRNLNAQGEFRNIIHWDRLGQANEVSLQLEFWGLQRFVTGDGVLEVY